jgi:hypothetical protein
MCGPIAIALLAAAPAMASTTCWMRCSTGPCDLATGPSASDPSATSALPQGKPFVLAKDCESLGPNSGTLQVRYRRNSLPYGLDADKTNTVAAQLKKYPADHCILGDAECQQVAQDARSGTSGGHRIDDRKGQPGGTGKPCTLWLPCGDVLVPDRAWTLRLKDETFAGTWRVSVARSADGDAWPDRDLAVIRGRVAVPAGLFKPGTLYAYRLLKAPASEIATGEFQSLSSSQANTVRQAAAKAEGPDKLDAWLKVLTEYELEWNVLQLMAAGEGETP